MKIRNAKSEMLNRKFLPTFYPPSVRLERVWWKAASSDVTSE